MKIIKFKDRILVIDDVLSEDDAFQYTAFYDACIETFLTSYEDVKQTGVNYV